MQRLLYRLLLLSLMVALSACPNVTPIDGGTEKDAGENTGADGGASGEDAGGEGQRDAGGLNDDAGHSITDAGEVTNADAGRDDAGSTTLDAGSGVDAGAPYDAGVPAMDAGATERDAGGGTDDAGSVVQDAGPPGPLAFTAVTFNTGTTNGLAHNSDGDDYGGTQVDWSDEHYGNGMAWTAAVDAATAFLTDLQPDIVAFQEIFHPGDCATIPANVTAGFVCENWNAGDPTVAQRAVGAGYQVACNLGKTDKCLAVKTAFGAIRGCDADLCLDGLDGAQVPDCGGGSRVGRATVDLVGGDEITVVAVHGTSGLSSDDVDCRIAQVEQVFLDLDGDASNGMVPGANGARNLVLGDLNTDPKRSDLFDDSAHRWLQFVDDDEDFHFISDIGFFAEPTYSGISNIDHVMSDVFVGSCSAPGVSPGVPAIYPNVYFDHVPIVCSVSEP